MLKPLRLLATALGCVAAVSLASPAAQADPPGKHDSNTLHKVGKAIAYPVRKAGQNTSITVHRALGHNSVVHRRNGNRTYRSVITPNGKVHRLHSLQAENRMKSSRTTPHYRYYRTYHTVNGHRYYRTHRVKI